MATDLIERSRFEAVHTIVEFVHCSDDPVAWNDREIGIAQFAVNEVEVVTADAADSDLEAYLAGVGLWG